MLITDVIDVIRFAQVRDSFITNVSEQLLGPTEALAKLADSLESGNLDEQQVAADARQGRSSCSKLCCCSSARRSRLRRLPPTD